MDPLLVHADLWQHRRVAVGRMAKESFFFKLSLLPAISCSCSFIFGYLPSVNGRLVPFHHHDLVPREQYARKLCCGIYRRSTAQQILPS